MPRTLSLVLTLLAAPLATAVARAEVSVKAATTGRCSDQKLVAGNEVVLLEGVHVHAVQPPRG
jgi:hypothetical protein